MNWRQAFEIITLLRIHHQVEQLERGETPDNFINPSRLSNLEKRILKESFQVISRVQDGIIDQYGPGMVGWMTGGCSVFFGINRTQSSLENETVLDLQRSDRRSLLCRSSTRN